MLRVSTKAIVTIFIGFLWSNSVSAYEGVEVTGGGSLVGQVTLAGESPLPRKIQVNKDQHVCGTEKLAEDLIVSKGKGIKNAVVSITTITKGKKMEVPKTPVSFDQKGCTYHPHVLVVPSGAKVEILNSDATLHNIHTYSFENSPINVAQPKFNKRPESVEVPEIIKVVCDVHKWMNAWWHVVDHPYYTVTDEEGRFTLRDIPPGTYEVRVWHETLRIKTQQVTITAGQETKLPFQFKPRQKG